MAKLKNLLLPVLVLFLAATLVGCSVLEKIGIGGSAPNRTRGEWYPVYWGGKQVGEAKFELEILEFNTGEQLPILTITEDIIYRGGNYIFTIVLAETVTQLTVKRYDRKKDIYIPGDSYRIEVGNNTLSRIRYGEDGEQIVETRDITDQKKLDYTEDLFESLGYRMRPYYGIYMYPGRGYEEIEEMISFGYDLLNYRKI